MPTLPAVYPRGTALKPPSKLLLSSLLRRACLWILLVFAAILNVIYGQILRRFYFSDYNTVLTKLFKHDSRGLGVFEDFIGHKRIDLLLDFLR